MTPQKETTRELRNWMKLAREWVFLTNPNFPPSLIIYLAEFGKYVSETAERNI